MTRNDQDDARKPKQFSTTGMVLLNRREKRGTGSEVKNGHVKMQDGQGGLNGISPTNMRTSYTQFEMTDHGLEQKQPRDNRSVLERKFKGRRTDGYTNVRAEERKRMEKMATADQAYFIFIINIARERVD